MAFRVIPINVQRDTPADVAASLGQGFLQGQQLRRQGRNDQVQSELERAKLNQLRQQTESINDPLPTGFVRLPGGDIKRDPTILGPFERQQQALLQQALGQPQGEAQPGGGIPQRPRPETDPSGGDQNSVFDEQTKSIIQEAIRRGLING